MHTTHLRKVGGSVMLAVPPILLDLLNLRAGVKVGLVVENGCLIIQSKRRPSYTLDELLAQCEETAVAAPEDCDWLEAQPIGNELL